MHVFKFFLFFHLTVMPFCLFPIQQCLLYTHCFTFSSVLIALCHECGRAEK